MQGRKKCTKHFPFRVGRVPWQTSVFFCGDASVKYLLGLSPLLTKKPFYAEQRCIHRKFTQRETSKDSLNLQLKRGHVCGQS